MGKYKLPPEAKEAFRKGLEDGQIYFDVRHHRITEEEAKTQLSRTTIGNTSLERIAYAIGVMARFP